MTELEQKYFELVYGEHKIITYEMIVQTSDIVTVDEAKKLYKTLDDFYAERICNNDKNQLLELKNKFSSYQKLRRYYKEERKNMFKRPFELVKWYEKQNSTCCYCGIKENDLEKYFNDKNPQFIAAKRKRGPKLEIERVETIHKNNYDDLENLRLACYICNNAKSDFVSAADFEPIAQGIHRFWKEKVGIKNIEFPIYRF